MQLKSWHRERDNRPSIHSVFFVHSDCDDSREGSVSKFRGQCEMHVEKIDVKKQITIYFKKID